ncbi:MAG: type II/IV secretion system protein [Candidatus Magasanikbacteria bacterium]|nr:type II/IV secretion system protein [Candidatus Magasanikbacteria bacterium]MBT4546986.1 type II/IV secretion system protein [Candidatus Magasanikbacteria bacterium]
MISNLTDKKIAEILKKETYISAEDLEGAKKYISDVGATKGLVDYLLEQNIINKYLLGQALGEYFGVLYINLSQQKIAEDVLHMVPEVVARQKGVVAFARDPEGVKVAMVNPNDLATKNYLEKHFGQKVIPYFTMDYDLDDAMSGYQASLEEEFTKHIKEIDLGETSREEKDTLIVDLVDMILKYGYQNRASDIHIEPYEDKGLVRLRIDGVMHDILQMKKSLLAPIITRLKILSRIRTDEHRAAQDGKLKYKTENETIDIRISILPVTQGENIVMRLLSSRSRQFGLSDLGFSSQDMKIVKRAIKSPHGMILVTGPTGSGKTTTLYSVMKILNKRDVHISTIEDPVEYDMEGISQIQVNNKTGLTFAKGLRSIVRQDPDIIMIGEIRDEETASIAVNSALTGHLVLSTLHTNDAPTTLPRLLDMNIESYLVASTVNIVIAQRLIRETCSNCKVSYKMTQEEKDLLLHEPNLENLIKDLGKDKLEDIRLYKGKGCKVCGDTGYDGRLGIFEVLEITEEIRKVILADSSAGEIRKVAKEQGMRSMMEDGVDKVLKGMTTFEEVLRVTRQ